ncbi:MAG: restriction endonuclease subunit S [Anaerolineae bacterium]
MRAELLKDICEINPRFNNRQNPEEQCSFVPMEFVDEIFAEVAYTAVRQVSDVQKGYTPFKNGDVLLAKITPCMENGKCAIAKNLINGIGFGSTEFHVMRAGESVMPQWIYYFIRQKSIRQRLARSMHGSAGQQRVPSEAVEELEIPLPPLPEQQRIAAILARADRLRRTCRYAQQLSNTFLQSVFLRMFGNPRANPNNWPIVKLVELGDLDRGRSRNRPRDTPELYGGPYPFIQTGDIANSEGYVREFKQTYSELGLQQSKMWPRGTLCITIAANIAKTSILTFDACFPDSVVGFIPNSKTNTEFIQQWFSFAQKELEETAPESAQKNINLEILRELEVALPPLHLQQQFGGIVHQFERLRAQQREAERQAEHLFQTLLHRAFNGEL